MEEGEYTEWSRTECGVVARLVSPKVPPESSEASGMSGDDEESCGEVSPSGT